MAISAVNFHTLKR